MLHRRPTAIAAPVLGLVLAASMSACGFHYPTDRVNIISAGVNNRTGSVEALGMRVLATAPHQGRLIGALTNELDTDAKLTKVADADGDLKVAKFAPVLVPGTGTVNLAGDDSKPVTLTGDFDPGDVLMNVQLTFTRGGATETVALDVPVVKPCYQYTAIPSASSSETSSGSSSAATGATSSGKATGAASSTSAPSSTSAAPTESSSESPSTDLFNCSDPSPTEGSAE